MNSCIQYKTKNREEKRRMSKYAIKKLKMKYKLGADASKAMMFAMTCVMAAARDYFLHINDSNFPSPFTFVIQLIMKYMQQLVFGSSNVFS